MINYKADCLTGPSIYGINGVLDGPGALKKDDIAATSEDLTLDDSLIGHWMTFHFVAAVHVRMGKEGDTLTAVATDRPVAAGGEIDFLVTATTQKIAWIGSGTTADGVRYWCSTTKGAV